jgi:hypothetical protein
MNSLRSLIVINKGLKNTIFRTTINTINWMATSGKVASKSNKPPGPFISELKTSVEKLTI